MYNAIRKCDVSDRYEIVKKVLVDNSAEQLQLYYDLCRLITKPFLIRHGFYEVDESTVVADVFMRMHNEKFEPFLTKDIAFDTYLNNVIRKVTFQQVYENLGITESEYRKCSKIKKVCEKYNIPMEESNAYKISLFSKLNINVVRDTIIKIKFLNQSKNMGDYEKLLEQNAI